MHRFGSFRPGALAGLALIVFGTAAVAQPATAPKPLSANDVSILFPAPKNQSDLANLIALSDLSGPTGSPAKSRLWSAEDFDRFLTLAEDSSQVSGSSFRIRLPNEVKRIEAWFVSGIRIDPGAPGLSPAIIAQFGQLPQIRFIVQPVTPRGSDGVNVHDIAGTSDLQLRCVRRSAAGQQLFAAPETRPGGISRRRSRFHRLARPFGKRTNRRDQY